MKYFVIASHNTEHKYVAVVYHDSKNGSFVCRSNKESFSRAFNTACSKTTHAFVKEGTTLRIVPFNSDDYYWVKNILDEICNDHWYIHESRDIVYSEIEIDKLVKKYLKL